MPMARLKPISTTEFLTMLKWCQPPFGWARDIAVANSGGPDSTCLLFLLHRCISEHISLEIPNRVASLNINHDLQPASLSMAIHCQNFAEAMGLKHLTISIPWGMAPYPSKPTENQAFEKVARDARYHALFKAMTESSSPIIAFGHHADDQVETSLMRLARGSTMLGAGGMKRVRRWGMGSGNCVGDLDWFGHEGMSRWIVRPLLNVNKDRILATCDENRLEYVNDPTNFQPDITLRNTIRHMIKNIDTESDKRTTSKVPVNSLHAQEGIQQAIQSLETLSSSFTTRQGRLHHAVQTLFSNAESIEAEVNELVKRCRLPAPMGTFLLSPDKLSNIEDPLVRTAFVIRVMRYVSFHPWGSVRAEAHRRHSSFAIVTENLWSKCSALTSRSFVAGAGVLWTPVITGGQDKTRALPHCKPIRHGEKFGWIASRQPPSRRQRTPSIDITEILVKARSSTSMTARVLYDNRFLVHFTIPAIPENVFLAINNGGRIFVHPRSRWFIPEIIMRSSAGVTETMPLTLVEDGGVLEDSPSNTTASQHEWASAHWIRPISAL